MKRKDNRPQIIIIGLDDFVHRVWRQIFPNFGLCLYKILQPEKTIDWSIVDRADVIIAQLDELGYGFKDCELLDTVITLYADTDKIIIAETNDYNAEIAQTAKTMGASGYIHRDELEEILGEALTKIVNGEKFFMGIPSHLQN